MADEIDVPKLIRCGPHGYAPWGIVCTHLLSGECKDGIKLPSGDYDYLCQECFFITPTTDSNNHLHCLCMHCIRNLRLNEVEPNFEE